MRAAPQPLQGDPARVPPDRPPGPVDVIVPVAGAPEPFARCLDSLLAHTDLERDRLIVVLDGPQPPEMPRLPEGALILKNPERQGFVVSVNRGMSVSDQDVILLNSDTQVTARWVDKLQEAAYSAPEIATVTPFSNSATICSLPRFLETNALPAGWDVERFGRLVEERSRRAYPPLPTGVGFCLYIKRKVLDTIGLFDTKSFGEGYGEETDFCMRALKAGYAHVLDDATFIFHEGQRSFGTRRSELVRFALGAMRRLHPEYLATVAKFVREDPVRPARERVVSQLLPARSPRPQGRPERVLHLVHGWPPWSSAGTELYAAGLVRRQAHYREVAVYARIADPERAKGNAVELLDHGARVRLMVNNFTQRDPLSRNALRDRALEADFSRLLDQADPQLLHIHHLAGHAASLVGVAARRGIPIVFQVQDWWQPCARVNLLDAWGRLCSGPGLGKCAACRTLTRLPLLNRALYAWRFVLMKKALRSANAFVMGSRFIQKSYLDLGYLRPENRTFVIPYGVDLPPPRDRSPRGTPLRFGAIGSSLPHKGIHVAVEAFAGIDPSRAKLTVWGDPPFEEERKPAIFAEMDALIVPSLGLESFGLVAREAMHHGVPVLASDRGALPEMFEGDHGALFDPEDPSSLRAWIERLVEEPEILDRWAAALPRVKGMDEHAEEIEAVYERVLERRR